MLWAVSIYTDSFLAGLDGLEATKPANAITS